MQPTTGGRQRRISKMSENSDGGSSEGSAEARKILDYVPISLMELANMHVIKMRISLIFRAKTSSRR